MVCNYCGASFEGRRADAKYCSETCASRKRGKQHYRRNRDAVRAANYKYNSTHPERRMHQRVKSRAKRNGVPFDLDYEDIVIPPRCPVLGIPINPNHGRRGYFPDSPSLDRIHPRNGYVKGNVRVISARANLLKNDARVEELEAVLEDLRRIHGSTGI